MSESVEERLAALEARVLALETGRAKGRSQTPKSALTAREFLLEKAPRSDNDKTLAAGYYLEIISGQDSFDFDGIEAFYDQAKEGTPANRRDPPYQLVEKGYFRKVGKRQSGMKARNRWALTNSGIARVEGGFEDGGSK